MFLFLKVFLFFKTIIFRDLWMYVMNYIHLKETQAVWVQKFGLYFTLIIQLAFKFAAGSALGSVECSTTKSFENQVDFFLFCFCFYS